MCAISQPKNESGARAVILCGPKLYHLNTCATLIRKGLNIVGICQADQRTAGLPLEYLRKSCKKKGLFVTLSRILARVAYQTLNGRRDRASFSALFDERSINDTLAKWDGDVHRTTNYGAATTLAWLKSKQPDLFVVHTPYWVGKAVRNIPRLKLVIGGHPGITPAYRGSHSAFWALYKGEANDVGCTVFLITEGVDTGDILAQERIPIQPGDSFMTLGWKGMIRIAELQAQLINELDKGIELPRRPIGDIPPDSEFDNPTLGQFIRYKLLLREHA